MFCERDLPFRWMIRCRRLQCAILISVTAAMMRIVHVTAYNKPYNFPEEAFVQDGDLMIGALFTVRNESVDQDNPCGGNISIFRYQQNVHALVYRIRQVNEDNRLLPNVTLGFVVLDDCRHSVTALGQALQFTQNEWERQGRGMKPCEHTSISERSNDTDPVESGTCTKSPAPEVTDEGDISVVGVIGPTSSGRAIAVNQLLSLYHIPQIGTEATSDVLSDPFDHAYFMRVVPPDKHQGRAIVDLIVHFNWLYIALLVSQGTYGSRLAVNVREEALRRGLCIGDMEELETDEQLVNQRRLDATVKRLLKPDKPRVVVLILKINHAEMLFNAVGTYAVAGRFIFIGSDTLDRRVFSKQQTVALGAMSLAVPLIEDPDFVNYLGGLNPDTSGGNPWFVPLWSHIFDCSWDDEHCRVTFPNISLVEGYFVNEWTTKTIDAVSVFAHGLDDLIREQCSPFVGNRSSLRLCVNRSDLLRYLKRVSFKGQNGMVTFDSNGDFIGTYNIRQWIKDGSIYSHRVIGRWSQQKANSSELDFHEQPVFYQAGNASGILEESVDVPRSVCSEPCLVGYIRILRDIPCCWDCKKCRQNEIMSDNGTSCEACPSRTWPNEQTRGICEVITPTHLAITSPFGITLAMLAVAGLILSTLWLVILVKYKNRKIIKASSVPITTIISVGFYISFISSFVFEMYPTAISCSISHVGFHLSSTILYGPLSIKIVRVYRIFAASQKCRRPTRMVTLRSQMVTIIFVIMLQIILIATTFVIGNMTLADADSTEVHHIFVPSAPKLRMPVETQAYVELFCAHAPLALYAPLGYNLVLLLVCDVAAFLTRHLPEAFNESWFVFLSVTSTLIVWLAFLPTYAITFLEVHRALLLSLALLISAVTNMAFMCGPKVYALWWIEDQQIASTYNLRDTMRRDRETMRSRAQENGSVIQNPESTLSGCDDLSGSSVV